MSRGYVRHSWAEPVKEIARWAFGHVDKAGLYEIVSKESGPIQVTGRWILQRIGTEALRDQVDQDFWIKVGLNKIDASEVEEFGYFWVNDDTRFPNEVRALRSRGFIIAYIAVPDHVRIARLGAEYDPVADTHPSETSVTEHDADVIVDGTLPPSEIADHLLEAAEMLG